MIFILIFLGTIGLSHGAIYWALVTVFPALPDPLKKALIILLFILAYGFIVTMLINRVWDNGLTAFAYRLFALWYGALVYLVMASAVILLVKAVCHLGGFSMPPHWLVGLAMGLYLIAISYTAWGFYHAQHPVVHEITVPVQHLPPHWQGKRIIQLSDVHIGGWLGQTYLSQLIRQVQALSPDLILITGDFWDGSAVNCDRYAAELPRLTAPKGVYFITGNHEVYMGRRKAIAALTKAGFICLDQTYLNLDGLQLIGVGFPDFNRKATQQIHIAHIEELRPDQPSILLNHTPTDIREILAGHAISHSHIYFKKSVPQFPWAQAHGITLQLSGHTHQGQMFPFELLTRYLFHGLDYGLHQLGHFYLYTSSGTGIWGPPIRAATRSEIVVIHLQADSS